MLNMDSSPNLTRVCCKLDHMTCLDMGVAENSWLTHENESNSLWSIVIMSCLSVGVNCNGSSVKCPSKFKVSWYDVYNKQQHIISTFQVSHCIFTRQLESVVFDILCQENSFWKYISLTSLIANELVHENIHRYT